ncbi:MAG: TetR/AcrR family transcriptional regulator [Myxococcota bacterium]|nr:TetR/AcrR family transcriptional regulator [Myxococcota bacterium]
MPKQVDHDERRNEVAAVAERLIAERGLDVGVLDVARAGGWSTSVVTHYFSSKHELLEHTMRRSLERAEKAVEARVARGQSRLQAIIEETLPLDASRRRRSRLFLVFWGRAVHDAKLREHQRRRHAGFRSTLARLIADALGEGSGRNPEIEARRLFALLDGLMVQAIYEPRLWPAAVQIEVVNRHLADLGLELESEIAA